MGAKVENMSLEHERIINSDAPTPTQLHKLAAIGISSAASRERLKHLKRSGRAHYFIDEIDLAGDFSLADDEIVQIRHRMAVRVGVRPPEPGLQKSWSLKYFDTFWAESRPGVWLGGRTMYRFEWNRNRATLAERTLRVVGIDRPDETLDSYLDRFSVRDDDAAILSVRQDVENVTGEDCEDLMRDASDYFGVIDRMQKIA